MTSNNQYIIRIAPVSYESKVNIRYGYSHISKKLPTQRLLRYYYIIYSISNK